MTLALVLMFLFALLAFYQHFCIRDLTRENERLRDAGESKPAYEHDVARQRERADRRLNNTLRIQHMSACISRAAEALSQLDASKSAEERAQDPAWVAMSNMVRLLHEAARDDADPEPRT